METECFKNISGPVLSARLKLEDVDKVFESFWAEVKVSVSKKIGGILRDSPCKGNPGHIEDLVQECAKVIKIEFLRYRVGGVRDFENPKAWAVTIARNLCLDHIKNEHRSRRIDSFESHEESSLIKNINEELRSKFAPSTKDPHKIIENDQKRKIAIKTFNSQSADNKRLICQKFSNVSNSEFASELGISEQTLRKQLQRALHRVNRDFRKAMGEENNND